MRAYNMTHDGLKTFSRLIETTKMKIQYLYIIRCKRCTDKTKHRSIQYTYYLCIICVCMPF